MKEVVAAFNQEKALVGAFSVIVQPVVEPMDSFTALVLPHTHREVARLFGEGFRFPGDVFLRKHCYSTEQGRDSSSGATVPWASALGGNRYKSQK